MNIYAKTKIGAALFALALAPGYAAAQNKPAAAPQYSGFLGDYSKLATAPDNPKAKRVMNR